VTFAGPQKDPKPYYGAADAFVLPTLYDPLPNAAMEAMACGMPIVTSSKSGAAELVQGADAGFVCASRDVATLAAHMRGALGRRTPRAVGRQCAERRVAFHAAGDDAATGAPVQGVARGQRRAPPWEQGAHRHATRRRNERHDNGASARTGRRCRSPLTRCYNLRFVFPPPRRAFISPRETADRPAHDGLSPLPTPAALRQALLVAFALAVVGMVVVAAGDLIMAMLVIPIVQTFQTNDPARAQWLPFAVIGVFLFRGIGSFVSEYGMAYTGHRVVFDLRRELTDKLLKLPTPYYDVTPSGVVHRSSRSTRTSLPKRHRARLRRQSGARSRSRPASAG